jgi:hypothetical protein
MTIPVPGAILANTEVFMCHLNESFLVDYIFSMDEIITRYAKSGPEMEAELLEACLVASRSPLATSLSKILTDVNYSSDWIRFSKYSKVLVKRTAAG